MKYTVGLLIFASFFAYAGTAKFNRVVIVVLENTNLSKAIKQPFLSELASGGALLSNFNAETHPSQGNYLAMVAGDTFGVNDDKPINLNKSHIGDLIEKAKLTWKVYAEDYPGNCFTGSASGNYVRKHNPFISFSNIYNDSSRCRKIVNAKEFDTDFASGNLPNYVFYVPELKNDGHDTGVAVADRWLSDKFKVLIKDPKFISNTLFIVTFDEGSGSNLVYTVLYGPSVTAGTASNKQYNHYNLLRTIEDAMNLGNLGRNDAQARPIDDVWK